MAQLTQKEQLQQLFTKIYGTDKRLLAIQLNGFSHKVFYDCGSSCDRILRDEYSAYAPEADGSDELAKQLLGDIPHSVYQGNPREIVYIYPEDR